MFQILVPNFLKSGIHSEISQKLILLSTESYSKNISKNPYIKNIFINVAFSSLGERQ